MTNNEMHDRILKNVKENIAISNIKEEFKNENKENSLIYDDKETNQILNITVAKERKIHYDFDFRNDSEKTYMTSMINGNEITIFYYSYEDYIDTPSNSIQYTCYYTNFEKDGTCFEITSYNVELEEFTKILSSLL